MPELWRSAPTLREAAVDPSYSRAAKRPRWRAARPWCSMLSERGGYPCCRAVACEGNCEGDIQFPTPEANNSLRQFSTRLRRGGVTNWLSTAVQDALRSGARRTQLLFCSRHVGALTVLDCALCQRQARRATANVSYARLSLGRSACFWSGSDLNMPKQAKPIRVLERPKRSGQLSGTLLNNPTSFFEGDRGHRVDKRNQVAPLHERRVGIPAPHEST